jgi:HK97 gp10 family phage protein
MAYVKVSMSLAGDAEVVRLLQELPQRLVKGALRKAVRAGANVVLRGAKFRAPRKSGLLAKTLKTRSFKRTRKNIVGFTVSTGAGDYKGSTFYGGFQEYGWRPTGRHRASDGIRTSQKWLREEKTAKFKAKKSGGEVPLAIRKNATAAKLRIARDKTRTVKPKHFLRDAFQDNAAQIQADLAKSIKAELQAAALKAATPKAPKK